MEVKGDWIMWKMITNPQIKSEWEAEKHHDAL